MKKLITMALVAGMVLSMAACGKKAASENSAVPESSVTASSETESASKEVEELAPLHKGDVTNRIVFAGGKDGEFTFDGTATFLTAGDYWYDEENGVAISALTRETGQGFRNTEEYGAAEGSEGSYMYAIEDDGSNWRYFYFQSDSSDFENKYYEIKLEIMPKDPNEEIDIQKYVDVFLSLVKGFVESGKGSDTKMSNVVFAPEKLIEFPGHPELNFKGGFVIQ